MRPHRYFLIFNVELKFMAEGSSNEFKTNRIFSFICIAIINNISRMYYGDRIPVTVVRVSSNSFGGKLK